MKRIQTLLFILVVSMSFTACLKDEQPEIYDPQKHFELEAPIIASYVDKDSTLKDVATKHENGIWYVIEDEGEGDYDYEEYAFPDVTVRYSGRLLDGTEFDNSDIHPDSLVTFNLGNVIYAWQIAIVGPTTIDGRAIEGLSPNGLQKGAKIRIVTPSPYAYGSDGKGVIPPDAPLDFTIEIVDLQLPQQ